MVDLDWNDSKITKLVITSTIGGNCRLRVGSELQSESKASLQPATGENPNPLYQTAKIKQPLVSAKANLSPAQAEQGILYDFDTQAGRKYVLVAR